MQKPDEKLKPAVLEAPIKLDLYKRGEQLLAENNISMEQLHAIGITEENVIKNLQLAVGKNYISIATIRSFLSSESPWSPNRLAAMLTNEGMLAMERGQLVAKDFCDAVFADHYDDGRALSAQEAFFQVVILKNEEIFFMQDAVADWEKRVYDFDSNIYRWMAVEEKEEKSAIDKLPKRKPIQDEKTVIIEDAEHKLPAGEKAILLAALADARKHRRQGCTELANNDRSNAEFYFLRENIKSLRESGKHACKRSIGKLKEKGIPFLLPYESKLEAGARLHYSIARTKETLMANCGEMSRFVIGSLAKAGYDKPDFLANITSTIPRGDHEFTVVGSSPHQWVVDAWSNCIFPFTKEHLIKHAKIWVPNKTPAGRNFQLKSYDPKKDKLTLFEHDSLDNLRFFRRTSRAAAGVGDGIRDKLRFFWRTLTPARAGEAAVPKPLPEAKQKASPAVVVPMSDDRSQRPDRGSDQPAATPPACLM